MIGVHIEWVHPEIGLLRGGRGYTYGKRYEFTALVLFDGVDAEIKGFLGYYSKAVRAEIKKHLKQIGVQRIKYERLNTGQLRDKQIIIT